MNVLSLFDGISCGQQALKELGVSVNYYASELDKYAIQTLPDNYTSGVSNTQRYKGIGNGWTVAVIKHIFKGIQS